jgi:ABC-type polysaccharide/polyol phosphate export permease
MGMSAATSDEHGQFEDTFPRPASRAREAWRDLSAGLSLSWMWTALAMQDIRLRYRGSVLGPFWLTLSTIIMVAAMGVIYARLFKVHPGEYLPYLALGLIIWQFILSLFTEGCQTFTGVESIIQQVPIPFSVHAYRVVFRNLIVFAHNAVIIPIGFVVFQLSIDWRVLLVVPALIVFLINGVWVTILFGMISARFRDVPPIVASLLQILFFATPIIWPVSSLGTLHFIADINPAYAAIEVIRGPLLGTAVSPDAWLLLIATTVVGCLVTFAFFARFRVRIAYWI